MGYPRRVCLPEFTYHAYSYFINRESFVRDNGLKDLLVKIIIKSQAKYTFDLLMYEIVEDELHLVIKTKQSGETISRIVQYIKSLFAKMYNRLLNRTGPVWNERFKSKILEFESDVKAVGQKLIFYLAYLPKLKGLVSLIDSYVYSGIVACNNQKENSFPKITKSSIIDVKAFWNDYIKKS